MGRKIVRAWVRETGWRGEGQDMTERDRTLRRATGHDGERLDGVERHGTAWRGT